MKKRYPWEIQSTHNLIAESEDGGERKQIEKSRWI